MHDLRIQAQHFLHALSNADFAKASSQFDSQMQIAVPFVVLSNTWRRLVTKVGRLRRHTRIEETKNAQHPEYRILAISCEFERGTYKMLLWFNSAGLISGMSIDQMESPLGVAQ